MVHRIDSNIHIRFEYDVLNHDKDKDDKNKTGYHVFCRTYQKDKMVSEHKVADALYETDTGLFIFPLQENIHKAVRNAYVNMHPAINLSDKAKWTDNGFLFKVTE